MTPDAANHRSDGHPVRPRIPGLRTALVAACLVALVAVLGGASAAVAPGTPPIFADWSPLNQPIPAGSPIDRRSAVMVQQLVDEANDKGWAIATHEWTAAIYHAKRRGDRVEIRRVGNVPWPRCSIEISF